MSEIDRAKFLKGLGLLVLSPGLLKLVDKVSAPDLPVPIAEGAPAAPSLQTFYASAASSAVFRNQITEVGYETALRAFEPGKYPTLEKAVANMAPATSPKVEWLDKKGRLQHNYTQIFRDGYVITNAQMASRLYGGEPVTIRLAALSKHLQNVENSLVWGRRHEARSETMPPVRALGGTIDFKGKTLALRPLRDLVLRKWAEDWHDAWHEEWLGEISLQVT